MPDSVSGPPTARTTLSVKTSVAIANSSPRQRQFTRQALGDAEATGRGGHWWGTTILVVLGVIAALTIFTSVQRLLHARRALS